MILTELLRFVYIFEARLPQYHLLHNMYKSILLSLIRESYIPNILNAYGSINPKHASTDFITRSNFQFTQFIYLIYLIHFPHFKISTFNLKHIHGAYIIPNPFVSHCHQFSINTTTTLEPLKTQFKIHIKCVTSQLTLATLV